MGRVVGWRLGRGRVRVEGGQERWVFFLIGMDGIERACGRELHLLSYLLLFPLLCVRT